MNFIKSPKYEFDNRPTLPTKRDKAAEMLTCLVWSGEWNAVQAWYVLQYVFFSLERNASFFTLCEFDLTFVQYYVTGGPANYRGCKNANLCLYDIFRM